MPSPELVLPFNVDGHWIIPTTPTSDPSALLPSQSMKKQQPQQQVLSMDPNGRSFINARGDKAR
jgi:hypothetical protein